MYSVVYTSIYPLIPQNMFGWIFTNKWCVVACTIQYDDDPICTNRWSKTNLFSYVYQMCIDVANIMATSRITLNNKIENNNIYGDSGGC